MTPELLAMLVKEFDDSGPKPACSCSGPVQYIKPGQGRVVVTMPYCYCERAALIEQAVRQLDAAIRNEARYLALRDAEGMQDIAREDYATAEEYEAVIDAAIAKGGKAP